MICWILPPLMLFTLLFLLYQIVAINSDYKVVDTWDIIHLNTQKTVGVCQLLRNGKYRINLDTHDCGLWNTFQEWNELCSNSYVLRRS